MWNPYFFILVYIFVSPSSSAFSRLTLFGPILACIGSSCIFHSGGREDVTVDSPASATDAAASHTTHSTRSPDTAD
ncbi:hypothetical protein FUT69_01175 [Xylella taiwanensis]|nr:hypothetical protein [Xylella taiwanensis]